LLRHALRRERRAENPFFGRFFTRIAILSGPNHALNAQITLFRPTEKRRNSDEYLEIFGVGTLKSVNVT